MILEDTYKEVQNPSSGTYKEKGSKFISYSYPVYTEKDIKDRIEEVKKIEHSARHYCYAFVLHPDKSSQRAIAIMLSGVNDGKYDAMDLNVGIKQGNVRETRMGVRDMLQVLWNKVEKRFRKYLGGKKRR